MELVLVNKFETCKILFEIKLFSLFVTYSLPSQFNIYTQPEIK